MAQYQSILTGPEIDAALQDMAQHDSEAWAVGTRDGAAVSSLDVTYHNNAKYYSDNAQGAAARAEAAVPASTAGAVFFDRAQTLTDAQKGQARTNIGAQKDIGNVLQLGDYASVGQARIPNLTGATVGWYRIADVDLTDAPNTLYRQILIMSGGGYSSGTPSEFALVASLPTFSNWANARVTQLSGHAGQNYTKIRFATDGGRHLYIEMYLAQGGGTATRGIQAFFIAAVGGELTTYEPTAPISEEPAVVGLEYTLQTTPTGAFGGNVFALPDETTVASIAALKTQMSAWATAQGHAVGFYIVAFSAASSPFVAGARVNIQLNLSNASNGTATLTTYGSSAAEMYLMRLYQGTWGDPKKVTVAS